MAIYPAMGMVLGTKRKNRLYPDETPPETFARLARKPMPPNEAGDGKYPWPKAYDPGMSIPGGFEVDQYGKLKPASPKPAATPTGLPPLQRSYGIAEAPANGLPPLSPSWDAGQATAVDSWGRRVTVQATPTGPRPTGEPDAAILDYQPAPAGTATGVGADKIPMMRTSAQIEPWNPAAPISQTGDDATRLDQRVQELMRNDPTAPTDPEGAVARARTIVYGHPNGGLPGTLGAPPVNPQSVTPTDPAENARRVNELVGRGMDPIEAVARIGRENAGTAVGLPRLPIGSEDAAQEANLARGGAWREQELRGMDRELRGILRNPNRVLAERDTKRWLSRRVMNPEFMDGLDETVRQRITTINNGPYSTFDKAANISRILNESAVGNITPADKLKWEQQKTANKLKADEAKAQQQADAVASKQEQDARTKQIEGNVRFTKDVLDTAEKTLERHQSRLEYLLSEKPDPKDKTKTIRVGGQDEIDRVREYIVADHAKIDGANRDYEDANNERKMLNPRYRAMKEGQAVGQVSDLAGGPNAPAPVTPSVSLAQYLVPEQINLGAPPAGTPAPVTPSPATQPEAKMLTPEVVTQLKAEANGDFETFKRLVAERGYSLPK